MSKGKEASRAISARREAEAAAPTSPAGDATRGRVDARRSPRTVTYVHGHTHGGTLPKMSKPGEMHRRESGETRRPPNTQAGIAMRAGAH